jgi:electron transport complex protein RnfC
MEMPLPALLRVSMAQHLGAPAKPLVKKGDTVLRGQRIGEPAGFISAAVHAPTSGTVKQVAPAPIASGGMATAIDIEPDGNDTWDPAIQQSLESRDALIREFNEHPEATRDVILGIIADAGIAGMGGAGFPTHVKLSPPPDKPIDTLIINGAECEPYLTADHRLMVERAQHVWAGCKLIQTVLGAKTLRIAIEDNKPEAIAAMELAIGEAAGDVAIAVLPTEYPQGAEKQQIFAITGRQVPSGGLPMDVGTVVENVGTTLAVWDAVVNGRPLTERVTTVTGRPVSNPGNVLNRIGTSYADLLAFCGGTSCHAAKVISGGPMMGLAQASLEVATTKTTSGLLFLDAAQVRAFGSMPCISCGRCVEACPMNLVPSELSQMIEAEDYETAETLNVLDCIECGCCAFACPAHRPLVQHMRQGKGRVMLKRKQEKKS